MLHNDDELTLQKYSFFPTWTTNDLLLFSERFVRILYGIAPSVKVMYQKIKKMYQSPEHFCYGSYIIVPPVLWCEKIKKSTFICVYHFFFVPLRENSREER